jgi:hypothetical protein
MHAMKGRLPAAHQHGAFPAENESQLPVERNGTRIVPAHDKMNARQRQFAKTLAKRGLGHGATVAVPQPQRVQRDAKLGSAVRLDGQHAEGNQLAGQFDGKYVARRLAEKHRQPAARAQGIVEFGEFRRIGRPPGNRQCIRCQEWTQDERASPAHTVTGRPRACRLAA